MTFPVHWTGSISYSAPVHLGTCSQKLLLLRPHQTQTAPSSACGGGNWAVQRAASPAGTGGVPAPGPQPLFSLAASLWSHPAPGGLRNGLEWEGHPRRAGCLSGAGRLAERCCCWRCPQLSDQQGKPEQLEQGLEWARLRLEETQTGYQADWGHSFPPKEDAEGSFSTGSNLILQKIYLNYLSHWFNKIQETLLRTFGVS